MKKLIFVAAALAAGVTAFAAQAESDRVTTPVARVAKTVTKIEKPDRVATKRNAVKSNSAAKSNKDADAPKTLADLLFGKEGSLTEGKKKGGSAAEKVKGKQVKSAAKSGGKRKAVALVAKKRAGKTEPDIDPITTAAVSTPKLDSRYGSIVSHYAASYGVPVSLAHAVISIESNYRVNARGSAGEIGLMQIKPATARMMGYSGSASGLFNPETNIKYGMKYLGQAHKLGGGATCGTILRYNAGHAARRMNPVSSAYCSKVKRHMARA